MLVPLAKNITLRVMKIPSRGACCLRCPYITHTSVLGGTQISPRARTRGRAPGRRPPRSLSFLSWFR